MSKILCLTLLIISFNSYSHMGNEFGPNGGYVKMHGAFHTEIVDKKDTLWIYLLDVNFKPLKNTQNEIKLNYVDKISKVNKKINCHYLEKKYFTCDVKKNSLTTGQLELKINQLIGKKMNVIVEYNLPLKLDK